MRLRLPIAFVLLSCAALPSGAVPPVTVKEYMAARKKQPVVSIQAAKTDLDASVGKVIEIRGRFSGGSRSDLGSNMVVCTPSDGTFILTADSLPLENSGTELACLARIGEGSTHNLSDLHLVCCTYDVELKRIDDSARRAREAKAAAAKPKPAPPAPASAKPKPAAATTLTADDLVRAYRNAIKGFNKRLTDAQADTIARSVLGFSYKYRVDARLVCAVILAESHFRVNATSRCGAQGLGQLMPTTAAGLGVDDAYDPIQNVYGSVRYIRSMLDRMAGSKQWNELTWGDLALALAAYNAGPGAVRKHGGIPPYRETQNYVKRVTRIYKQLCGVSG